MYQFANKSRYLKRETTAHAKKKITLLQNTTLRKYQDIRYEKLSTQYRREKEKNNLKNKMRDMKQDTKSDV